MPSHKSTLSNAAIGLNSANIADSNINASLWNYVSMKHSGAALAGEPLEQASVPKGTVDEAHALRKRILQLSIAPDITGNKSLKIKGASRLG